jgi:hypothetical protein
VAPQKSRRPQPPPVRRPDPLTTLLRWGRPDRGFTGREHKADGIIAALLTTGPVTADTIGALLDAEQDSGVAPF